MTQFARNFGLQEFLKTNRKVKLTPSPQEIENMRELSMYILQPFREDLNEPISVTQNGGYRGNGLNELIGGSEKSDHKFGKASDITSKKFTKIQLFKKLLETVQKKGLAFKQIILELDSNCLHVSYDKTNNKCEILVREKVGKDFEYKRLSLAQGINFDGKFA